MDLFKRVELNPVDISHINFCDYLCTIEVCVLCYNIEPCFDLYKKMQKHGNHLGCPSVKNIVENIMPLIHDCYYALCLSSSKKKWNAYLGIFGQFCLTLNYFVQVFGKVFTEYMHEYKTFSIPIYAFYTRMITNKLRIQKFYMLQSKTILMTTQMSNQFAYFLNEHSFFFSVRYLY